MATNNDYHSGFVYMTDTILDIRYCTSNNFVGTKITSYDSNTAILTEQAANALKKINDCLISKGYIIKIFDAYRPQSAVDHFIRWAKDLSDTKMKEVYYPNTNKSDLFKLGYIAYKSGHSRGSTVDVTIVEISSNAELDMGSDFDFFGEISNHGTTHISHKQAQNRNLLKNIMLRGGFKAFDKEWWHYTLENEPFPDTYFDFTIK